MKKRYISPEMEILLLELSDIITTSGGTVSGGNGAGVGGDMGDLDDWN